MPQSLSNPAAVPQSALTEERPVLGETVQLQECPVCSSRHSRPWRLLKGWQLDRCTSCTMIYVNPRPSERALKEAYSLPKPEYDRFFQSEYIDSDKILGGSAQWQRSVAADHLEAIENALGRKGRLLEIGCSSGLFLEVAQSRGWQTAGVDPGDWRDPDGKNNDAQLNIKRCTLFDAGFPETSFDVIYMGSVLEHLPDPYRYVETFFRLLKPGGIVHVVGLPNIDSWTIRIGIDRWIGNHPPLHLLYFSRRTASRLFERAGFAKVGVKSYGLSETILEMLFNRKQQAYTGDYARYVTEPTLRGRAIHAIRSVVYKVFDVTGTGSVLEVFATKGR